VIVKFGKYARYKRQRKGGYDHEWLFGLEPVPWPSVDAEAFESQIPSRLGAVS